MIEVRLNPDVTPAGSDLSIVNAARRSFNTRSEVFNDKDKRLLQFLARGMTAGDFEDFVHGFPAPDTEERRKELVEKLWQWRNTPTHDTPFNHTFISFEVKAPIFVRAQLVKHEYLIMSEFSRRYITDDIEFYTPDKWRKAAENKKQGSSDEEVDLGFYEGHDLKPLDKVVEAWGIVYDRDAHSHEWSLEDDVKEKQEEPLELYNQLLKVGVAPEQARMVLPQSVLTEWTWSGTLGAFAKMCQLRIHPEAQYEARLVAQQVYDYLKEYYPVAAKALVEGADV